MHYLANLHEKKASLAILCQVKPAVQLLVDINSRGQEAFTSRVLRMLEAAKRKAAKVKEPVRKAGEVSLDLLKRMVEKHIQPYERNKITIIWPLKEEAHWEISATASRQAKCPGPGELPRQPHRRPGVDSKGWRGRSVSLHLYLHMHLGENVNSTGQGAFMGGAQAADASPPWANPVAAAALSPARATVLLRPLPTVYLRNMYLHN